ncbi:hypothetical protein [Amycolatopsis minnesotensis]|uniref:Uncharacterized protein n=1 Tax=Amycolatopsis minnesotensis TaxID=337894 RepID=A0ABP5BI96_9PSEU
MKSARARTGIAAAAAVSASALALLAATPAVAASSQAATLTIVSAAVSDEGEDDDSVDVVVTYACDSGYTGTIYAYVNDVAASAFGGSDDTAATCDGTSHTADISVENDNDATEFTTGDSAAVGVALDAEKAGAPDLNAAHDVTLTLG